MAGPYTVQHTNGASSVSNDRADGAIVKVDTATVQPLWAIGMGRSVDTTRALAVAVDSEDNAVLTGEVYGGHDCNHQLVLETTHAQWCTHPPLLLWSTNMHTIYTTIYLTGNYRAPLTVSGLPVLQPLKIGVNNGFGTLLHGINLHDGRRNILMHVHSPPNATTNISSNNAQNHQQRRPNLAQWLVSTIWNGERERRREAN